MDVFGPSARDPSAPPGTIAYAKPGRVDGTSRFTITRPVQPGAIFDYSRSAFIDTDGASASTTQPRTTAYCILGVPTVAADVPAGGTITFTRFAVRGEAFDKRGGSLESYTLDGSTVTMVVTATGQFTSTLRLIGRTQAGVVRDIGTYNVQGFIGPNPDIPLSGQTGIAGSNLVVSGAFFGPQAREFGYYFQLSQTSNASPFNVELLIVGTVLGERDS
jgi:hypothetical protein